MYTHTLGSVCSICDNVNNVSVILYYNIKPKLNVIIILIERLWGSH